MNFWIIWHYNGHSGESLFYIRFIRGTLKKEDPKPLRDNGIHSLIGTQKRLRQNYLQHANKKSLVKNFGHLRK